MNTDLKQIGERLKAFMLEKRIGVNAMGRITGTSGAQIHNILKGKKYGTDKLINICKAFPELRIEWLVFGIKAPVKVEHRVNLDELHTKFATGAMQVLVRPDQNFGSQGSAVAAFDIADEMLKEYKRRVRID